MMVPLVAVLCAVTVSVSPVGNDANDGTEQKPLATVEAARNAVRKRPSFRLGSHPT